MFWLVAALPARVLASGNPLVTACEPVRRAALVAFSSIRETNPLVAPDGAVQLPSWRRNFEGSGVPALATRPVLLPLNRLVAALPSSVLRSGNPLDGRGDVVGVVGKQADV